MRVRTKETAKGATVFYALTLGFSCRACCQQYVFPTTRLCVSPQPPVRMRDPYFDQHGPALED